ncbi:hypothetical protein Droror1_Dr00018260 [Drosera rotundifolia]
MEETNKFHHSASFHVPIQPSHSNKPLELLWTQPPHPIPIAHQAPTTRTLPEPSYSCPDLMVHQTPKPSNNSQPQSHSFAYYHKPPRNTASTSFEIEVMKASSTESDIEGD